MAHDEQGNSLALRTRLLADNVNQEVYEQRKYLLGRILTIVDASISDTEQRKAAKDLIHNEFFADSYWNNIRENFEQFSRAEGFKFEIEHAAGSEPKPSENPYEKIG